MKKDTARLAIVAVSRNEKRQIRLELIQLLSNAQVEVDNDGQLIIYTNVKESK